MPRYFFDTSALVKHYHTELGSPNGDQILGDTGSEYAISRLTLVEVSSVFAKKVRMGEISDTDFDQLRLRFYADVRNRTLIPVRIMNAQFKTACDLIARHGKARRNPHSRRNSARGGSVDCAACPHRSLCLRRPKTLRDRRARGARCHQS